MYGSLVVLKKNGSDGLKYPMDETTVSIGRDEENSIRIQRSEVSRHHALIEVDGAGKVRCSPLSLCSSLCSLSLPLSLS